MKIVDWFLNTSLRFIVNLFMSTKITEENRLYKHFSLGNNLNELDQLKLTMIWNRVDIAKNKIYMQGMKNELTWTVFFILFKFYYRKFFVALS